MKIQLSGYKCHETINITSTSLGETEKKKGLANNVGWRFAVRFRNSHRLPDITKTFDRIIFFNKTLFFRTKAKLIKFDDISTGLTGHLQTKSSNVGRDTWILWGGGVDQVRGSMSHVFGTHSFSHRWSLSSEDRWTRMPQNNRLNEQNNHSKRAFYIWYISLPSSAKQQREMTQIVGFPENVSAWRQMHMHCIHTTNKAPWGGHELATEKTSVSKPMFERYFWSTL